MQLIIKSSAQLAYFRLLQSPDASVTDGMIPTIPNVALFGDATDVPSAARVNPKNNAVRVRRRYAIM
jgi:hypothetical protein